MAEYIREIIVVVEVDTNKTTYKRTLVQEEGESIDDFTKRIHDYIKKKITVID